MAVGKVTCTCSKCGKEIVLTKKFFKREDANNWEEYMKESKDFICYECKKADEKEKMKQAIEEMEKDLELSRKVIKDDDIVDELFEEVKTTLIDFIAENKGEQGVEAIDLIMVAKYLERIADHATNIAEWVEFSITGIHKASVV